MLEDSRISRNSSVGASINSGKPEILENQKLSLSESEDTILPEGSESPHHTPCHKFSKVSTLVHLLTHSLKSQGR